MEQRIKKLFTDYILDQARARYDIPHDAIRLWDGFESFIYEFDRDGARYILRIAHSSRRSEAMINSEVDWINYLAAGGASVAKAIPSVTGRFVEPIPDESGEFFLATAFIKAIGKSPYKFGWTSKLYERYGQLLGKMHALSKDYVPAAGITPRPHWDDPEMLEVERLLPTGNTRVIERYRELLKDLNKLPRDGESYGLIHQDAHGGNFFVTEAGKITIFDFDDCAQSWYLNDLAIVLFYIVMSAGNREEFTRYFLKHFMFGYHLENRLDSVWFKEIPNFLKLREIDLYAVIHRSFEVANLTDPWCQKFMAGRKEKIEQSVPYLNLNFSDLVEDWN